MDILSLIQKEFHKHPNCVHILRPSFVRSPHIVDHTISAEHFEHIYHNYTRHLGRPAEQIITKYFNSELVLIFRGYGEEPELLYAPEQFSQESNRMEFRREHHSRLDSKKFPCLLELDHREQTRDLVWENHDIELRLKTLLTSPATGREWRGEDTESFSYDLTIKDCSNVARYVENLKYSNPSLIDYF